MTEYPKRSLIEENERLTKIINEAYTLLETAWITILVELPIHMKDSWNPLKKIMGDKLADDLVCDFAEIEAWTKKHRDEFGTWYVSATNPDGSFSYARYVGGVKQEIPVNPEDDGA